MDRRSIVFDKVIISSPAPSFSPALFKVEPPRRRQLGYGVHHASEENVNMRNDRLVSANTQATFEFHNDILGLARLPQQQAKRSGEYVGGAHAAIANRRDDFYDRVADQHPVSPKHATAIRHLNMSPTLQHSVSSPTLSPNKLSKADPYIQRRL
jgi:hypothetical protein